MANLAKKVAYIASKRPFLHIFSIFSPKMRLRLTQNAQFHLIHNFSHLLPLKRLIFGEISKIFISGGGGGNINKFFEFSNFFKSFHTNLTENDPQLQIWLKNGLYCVKMANLAYFSIFSPKMRLRLTQNGQFHLIHNFSHLLPPKHLIFEEISKFLFLGGYIGKFFEFSNFFKSFHTNLAENDPQWQIWPKKWLILCQNSQFGMFFYLFPQNEAEIYLEWSSSPDSQLFPSFASKASHFWRNLKNFCF